MPVDRSRAELEKLLRAAGSTKIGFMHDGDRAVVLFELGRRAVRMSVEVPSAHQIAKGAGLRQRWSRTTNSYASPTQRAEKLRDQEERRRWRVLVLVTKAKLEAVRLGISTIEREFLADIIVKGGTVGELLRDQLEALYAGGSNPLLLP